MFWWWLIHPGQRLSAAWHGLLDGLRRIPGDESDSPSTHMQVMHARGQEQVRRIALTFYRRDQRRRLACVAAEGRLEYASEHLRLAEAQAAESRQEHQRQLDTARALDLQLNPPGTWYCPPWAYRMAILLLAAADAPLTFWAMQTFDISTLYIIPVTCLVVLSLAVLGHFAGEYMRRLHFSPGWLLTGVVVLSTFLTGSLTALREAAVAIGAAGDVSPLATGAVFLGITVVGFAVPALLAVHVRHMPWKGELARAKWAWLVARFRFAAARRGLLHARHRRDRALTGRQAEFDTRRRQCETVSAMVAKLLHIYMTANVRWRKGHVTPPGLQVPPVIPVPDSLGELTWGVPDTQVRSLRVQDWGLKSAD